MKLVTLSYLTAFAIALAAPVSAQTGGTNPNTGSNSTGTPGVMPNNSGTGVGGQTNSNGSDGSMRNDSMSSAPSGADSTTCQGMMDQMNSGSGSQSATATREMSLAKKAQAKGQEKTCMSHMHKAMNASH